MPGFAEIYERIKLATNSRTQVELAEVLDIRQSSISDAKRRNSVPGDWFMKLFEKFGLNPDWLKQGVGPMYLRTEQGYVPEDAPASLAETAAHYGDAMARGGIHSVYDAKCVYTDDAPVLPWLWRARYRCRFHSPVTAFRCCGCAAPTWPPLSRKGRMWVWIQWIRMWCLAASMPFLLPMRALCCAGCF